MTCRDIENKLEEASEALSRCRRNTQEYAALENLLDAVKGLTALSTKIVDNAVFLDPSKPKAGSVDAWPARPSNEGRLG